MAILPDWWTLRRLAGAAEFNWIALSPTGFGTILIAARPYLGLNEGQLAEFLSSPSIREAFVAFLGAAALWIVTRTMTLVFVPSLIRDHPSRLAAVESFGKASGLSIEDPVAITQTNSIESAAVARPFARAVILSSMVLSALALLSGIVWSLRPLLLLPR